MEVTLENTYIEYKYFMEGTDKLDFKLWVDKVWYQIRITVESLFWSLCETAKSWPLGFSVLIKLNSLWTQKGKCFYFLSLSTSPSPHNPDCSSFLHVAKLSGICWIFTDKLDNRGGAERREVKGRKKAQAKKRGMNEGSGRRGLEWRREGWMEVILQIQTLHALAFS